jgi:ArsR family transcriptional regulator, arsenate/arsenite/antimonite-responsive transcriptional repressor
VTSRVVDSTSLETRAEILAALADPIRLRIVDLLVSRESCVCDLRDAVGVAPNLLSYHLRVLREAGLIEGTRRGRWIDYRLTANAAAKVKSALPAMTGSVEAA